jgi:NADH-quinone oxidoreductase subunit G
MDKPKVNLTINGKAVQAEAGTTVFQAAEAAGIFIPHYCYHPDLSIAGVCRMCMCEVEKNPKLQISCNTPVAEGMVVRTDTPKVKETVKGVLELHLINHPIDCPICDKAGECKLQDYYRDYGLYESRMDYDKVHKPKVVDIGTIVLDSERCILCSRCVRFTSEVTKTNELGIFNRGDRAELRTHDGGPLHNEYTGNLADICPVGALTAKDFRFACRVWFLEKTDSVCTQCAHACSTTISVKPQTRTLYRVEPRRNPEVNKSWICDTGRWDYHYVSNDKRVRVPRRYFDSQWQDVSWNEAAGILSDEIAAGADRVLAALSTQMTNEEIVDSVTTLKGKGITHFMWVVDEAAAQERKPYDGLLKHHDVTVNALGFQTILKALGVSWLRYAQVEKMLATRAFDRVLVLGLEGELLPGVAKLMGMIPRGMKTAVHTTSMAPCFENCDLILPGVSSFEKNGTVISALGRLQKVNQAIPWQYTGRDAHSVLFAIARGDDRETAPSGRAQELFESTVVDKILMGKPEKWRSFRPMGLPLAPAVVG